MSTCGIDSCRVAARWRVVVRVWPVLYWHPHTGERMDKANPNTPSMLIEAVTNPERASIDPKQWERHKLDLSRFHTLCVCDFHMQHMPDSPAAFFTGENRERLSRGWDARDLLPIDWELAEWRFEALENLHV